jgi:hypothetical protein
MFAKQFAGFSLALMLCLVAPLPSPSWAACKVNSSSDGIQHGSVVVGSSVTICGSAQSVQPGRKSTVSKVQPKVQSKVTSPVVVKPAPRKANQYDKHRGWVTPPVKTKPKVVAKPKISLKKVVKKTTKITPPSSTSKSAEASFNVQDLAVSVSPGLQVAAGQVLLFGTNASTHFGRGNILGKNAEVRFSLRQVGWQFGDDTESSVANPQKAFWSEGQFEVVANATYSVAYRLAGATSWNPSGAEITTSAKVIIEVVVDLETQTQETADRRVLLVGEQCRADLSVFGCG